MIFFRPSALSNYKENLEKVAPIIEYARKTYPNAPLFAWLAAQYERKKGLINDAIKSLKGAIESCQKMGLEPNLYIWDLANCYFMNLDWKNAAIELEKIVLQGEKQVKANLSSKFNFIYFTN